MSINYKLLKRLIKAGRTEGIHQKIEALFKMGKISGSEYKELLEMI